MPIYEYRCPDCGHEFEQMRKMSDPPLKDCPACGAADVRRLISRTSFQLKGGGWYNDHYGLKSGGSTTPAKPDAPAATGGDGAGGTTPSSTPPSSTPPSSTPPSSTPAT